MKSLKQIQLILKDKLDIDSNIEKGDYDLHHIGFKYKKRLCFWYKKNNFCIICLKDEDKQYYILRKSFGFYLFIKLKYLIEFLELNYNK